MLTAREAVSPCSPKSVVTAQDILASLTARISAARAQGARSIWVGQEDGYMPLGSDHSYQKPSTALIEVFEILVRNEYYLVFDMRHGKPHVRVSFRPEEIGLNVDLGYLLRPTELEHLYTRLDDGSLER